MNTKITDINVDDYIREAKLSGVGALYWNKKDVKTFRRFARIIYHDSGFRLLHSFPSGDVFMGIKHYTLNNNYEH